MSSTLVCDCAIHTIVFFGEFWLTSAASRQNSSEQNGRSTYCAARHAPPRSGGYSEAVYNGVWQIANLHFWGKKLFEFSIHPIDVRIGI